MTNPLLAVLAGILTVASPCVLPMLPVVLGASLGKKDRSRPLFIALGFALAFSAFALLFASFSQVLGLKQETLRDAAAVTLLLFGISMIWRRPFDRLTIAVGAGLNRVNALADRAGPGRLGGLLLGTALGALWTPCAGPVLGAILTWVATAPDITQAGLLLLCFSAGAALPMMAIAYGGQFVTARLRLVTRRARVIQQTFGVFVIATAIATLFQYDAVATVWLSRFYPSIPTSL
ncbi:MAG: cytochrome c biogenesis CcdA family protein [Pseudomonadota bacterium]